MSRPDWIAVDWGTSHVRAWAMTRAGAVLDHAQSDDGMSRLDRAGFEPALLRLVEGWLGADPVDVIACGMVGARQGWVEAPYTPVPCAPIQNGLVRAATRDARLRVHVVPGLKQAAPADVMRGEETQIAGALALQPGFDGVLVLPGTHSKWAQISAGEVVSFRSFLTGEMFALLAGQSVLRHSVGAGWDADAFGAAVSETLSRPESFAARLFSIRAEGLLAGLVPAAARARLSGLLIGAELAATRPYWLGQNVAILGEDAISDAYAAALRLQGIDATRFDGAEATRKGLSVARAALAEVLP